MRKSCSHYCKPRVQYEHVLHAKRCISVSSNGTIVGVGPGTSDLEQRGKKERSLAGKQASRSKTVNHEEKVKEKVFLIEKTSSQTRRRRLTRTSQNKKFK